MTLRIQTHVEPELLRVIAKGQFSLEDALQKFLDLLDAVERTEARKILLDGRQVTGNPTVIDRFLYGEFAAKAVKKYMTEGEVRHPPQFAYVLHEPVLDPKRFGETVAVNRGMWLKVFDNLEDAGQWLGVGSAPRGAKDGARSHSSDS